MRIFHVVVPEVRTVELGRKIVLITGASSGIGAAAAREFARAGATVALVARSKDRLDELAAEIGPNAHAFPADLADPDAVLGMAARVRAELGVPDVIVNNAGAGRWLFADESTPHDFRDMAAVPYLAAGYVTTAFAADMVRRGSGRIVVVNSPVSRATWPGAFGYAAARWGLRGIVAALRVDLRGTGVGVTEIVPGKVSSDYFANNPGSEERIPSISAIIPTVTPEQVARALVASVRRDRSRTALPFMMRVTMAQAWIAPSLTHRLMSLTGAKRP
ncbi:SDR family NAD(P)-dependent oxidoreductase [Actinomadura rupiterrae]|uniref:SDR family NAD(P)-dependent oxidoreductase n=1 Tax=Actinomadura rupiterrae TaxID=559627 RepID=UPI0020A470A8|nr:SDR family oxidoreductase [Actinomadura rupiterrae]MCP2335147.1 NADP-dependent 3-hydroxy acid dehydrogenase YdfG [Actinomadura rupiterrae]